MSILGTAPDDWTQADFEELVDYGIQEDDRLDFKRDIVGTSDDDKREFLRDVTAMANHRGGYLVYGVDENNDAAASELIGVEPGQIERLTSMCLASTDERIPGLRVIETPMQINRVLLTVVIPESANAPHMVTFKGLNQFWKRHGRLKDKMSIEEIRDAVRRSVDTVSRIERFMDKRHNDLMNTVGGRPFLVLRAIPATFLDRDVINVRDPQIRTQARGLGPGQQIDLPASYPTINGIRANYPLDSLANQQQEFFELFRNGYAEYGRLLSTDGQLGMFFAARDDAQTIVAFVGMLHRIYSIAMPGTPVIVRCTLFFTTGLRLALPRPHGTQFAGPWPAGVLDLGSFRVDDLATERRALPKRMCDRLWNAFGLEEADIFGEDGQAL